MASHNQLGKAGEDAAIAYLERNGYVIRHRNWRLNHLEIDIVAVIEGEIVFVEVKTRSTLDYQDPIEAVTPKKIRRLLHAADAYLKQFAIIAPGRFDVMSISGNPDNFKIEHIPDAFSPLMF